MITAQTVTAAEWETISGWHLEEKGWCSGDRCVPVAGPATDGRYQTIQLAQAMQRAVVTDGAVVSVGPQHGDAHNPGSLAGVALPNLTLVDRQGNPVMLASLVARRRRMVIHAWAPW
jgi:hypothetical protein